jgi:hypothetical protein
VYGNRRPHALGSRPGFVIGVGADLLTDWLVGDAGEADIHDIAR